MSTSKNPAASDRRIDPADGSGRPPPPPHMSTRGVVIGTILLGVLLLGFAFWANEAGKRAGAEARSVPSIQLLEPGDGQVVGGVVEIVFETAAELRRGPAGWEARGLHIHAALDGMELMPGADDVLRLDGNRYRWLVRPLEPGTRELRLFWSDRHHRAIAEGASRTVRIEAR
jgi:hypothetical protein